MADPKTPHQRPAPEETPHQRPTREDPPVAAEETFKREGPVPPAGSTGDTVDEMNEAARDAVLRNIRPGTPED